MIRCNNVTKIEHKKHTQSIKMSKHDNTTKIKSVLLEQRLGNERSFMQLCGVVGDLIIVPFGSEVMVKWLGCFV